MPNQISTEKTDSTVPDDKEQSARFIKVAQELEVDESGKTFESVFDTIKLSTPKSHAKEETS